MLQNKKNVANTHNSGHNKQILELKNLNLNLGFKYKSMQQNIFAFWFVESFLNPNSAPNSNQFWF